MLRNWAMVPARLRHRRPFEGEEMTMNQPALRGDSRAIAWTAFLALVAAGGITPSNADDNMRSSPPDTTSYSRPAVAEDFDPLSAAGKADPGKPVQFDVFVVDTVVNNTDSNLKLTDTFNDGEISIAVRPQHPEQLVIASVEKSRQHLDERVYDQPAARSSRRSGMPV